MEKMLQKLARQLDGMDEASLMALWSKYATITSRFEPTRRWEEACLIFSLIQAKRFKNQLFNYCWKQARQPGMPSMPDMEAPDFDLLVREQAPKTPTACRVLPFSPQNSEEKES